MSNQVGKFNYEELEEITLSSYIKSWGDKVASTSLCITPKGEIGEERLGRRGQERPEEN